MNEWIKASEQLPPLNQEILGIDETGHYMLVSCVKVSDKKGQKKYWEDSYGNWLNMDEVAYWQFLPVIPEPIDFEVVRNYLLKEAVYDFRNWVLQEEQILANHRNFSGILEEDFGELANTIKDLYKVLTSGTKEDLARVIAENVITPCEKWKYEFEKSPEYLFEYTCYLTLCAICDAEVVKKCLS